MCIEIIPQWVTYLIFFSCPSLRPFSFILYFDYSTELSYLSISNKSLSYHIQEPFSLSLLLIWHICHISFLELFRLYLIAISRFIYFWPFLLSVVIDLSSSPHSQIWPFLTVFPCFFFSAIIKFCGRFINSVIYLKLLFSEEGRRWGMHREKCSKRDFGS